MAIDSSKVQRWSSRARKSVSTFILSDVNAHKSNHNVQIDVSDERGLYCPGKSPSVVERGK